MPGTDPLVEMGLPCSPDAERAVLGGVLLDNLAFDLSSTLTVSDFFVDANRRIYHRMQVLRSVHPGWPIDFTTLTEDLIHAGELEQVGGMSYLSTLTDGLPRAVNVGHHAKIIKRLARRRAMIQAAHAVFQEGLGRIGDGEEDAESAEAAYISRSQESIMALRTSESATLVHAAEIVPGLTRMLDSGTVPGVPTGFDAVDTILACGGWATREFHVLMAGSQMGKTALMLGMAECEAQMGIHVCIISMETTAERLLLRLCCQRKGISVFKALRGWLDRYERAAIADAMRELSQMPIYIDDSAGTNATDITTRCRRLRAIVGPKAQMIAYIDFLQLMDMPQTRGTRNDQIAEVCRQLKNGAKELNAPVVALSQITDLEGEAPPEIKHMRDSRTPYEQSYTTMSLWREDQANKNKDGRIPTGKALITIHKDKDGPTGKCELAFEGKYTRFGNIEQDQEEPRIPYAD